MDDLGGALDRGLQGNEVWLVLMSGILSVSINLTSLIIIGNASPVTYQVVGKFFFLNFFFLFLFSPTPPLPNPLSPSQVTLKPFL